MTADANGFYKYTITGPTSVNLIFNNGSSGAANQTADLLNKTDGYSYTWGASTSKLGTKKEVAATKSTSIGLYPNPVSNLLQINSDVTALDYQILSNNGTAVQKGKVNDNSIDLYSLPSGLYFVKIHFIDGQEYLQKIIKK